MNSTLTPAVPAATLPTAADIDGFQWFLEATRKGEPAIAPHHLERGAFKHAIYDAEFRAFREGRSERFAPSLATARIRPIFAEPNQPRCIGFQTVTHAADGSAVYTEFDLKYFHSRGQAWASTLRNSGALPADQTLAYIATAYPTDDEPAPAAASNGRVMTASQHLEIRDVDRPRDGVTAVDDLPDDELPVYIAREVLDDALADARGTPDQEVGGLLLGNLCRDPIDRGLFVMANCYVSGAGTTINEAARMTFTPDTFAQARKLMAVRAAGGVAEVLIGWVHSHGPFTLCDHCDLAVQGRECIDRKILFYSVEDLSLMESVFPQPFHLGLLTAVEPRVERVLGHAPVRLFAYRRGAVRSRGFYVVDR